MLAWIRSLPSKPATLARALLSLLVVFEAGVAFLGPSARAAKEVLANAKAGGDLTSHWEPLGGPAQPWAFRCTSSDGEVVDSAI